MYSNFFGKSLLCFNEISKTEPNIQKCFAKQKNSPKKNDVSCTLFSSRDGEGCRGFAWEGKDEGVRNGSYDLSAIVSCLSKTRFGGIDFEKVGEWQEGLMKNFSSARDGEALRPKDWNYTMLGKFLAVRCTRRIDEVPL